jgi:DNA-binding transcriptional regulator GbsR (MarR family)
MKKVNLLFFLNAIMKTVVDSLEGSFEKSAKYKFNKVVNSTTQLEKELLKNCKESAHTTYNKASTAVAEVLNMVIEAYNDEKLVKFVEYCKKFEDGKGI